MSWCERHDVGYIHGLARNTRLAALAAPAMTETEAAFHATGRKQRLFTDLVYGADTWNRKRMVIGRLEHGDKGANPRFVVTNLEGDGGALYDKVYCQRGEMENCIKEQQLHLFADRTSCHEWWADQFRLLLASLAYTLVNAVRSLGLKDTDMARAGVQRVQAHFDIDSMSRAAFLCSFIDAIKDKRAHGFYVKYSKHYTVAGSLEKAAHAEPPSVQRPRPRNRTTSTSS